MSNSDSCEPIILLVEGDSNLRERLATALRVHGCCVHAAADLAEAVHATNTHAFDYAVVEPKSSEGLLRRLRQSSPKLSILVFTGYRRAASQVMRDLGVHFLQKPADADDVSALWASTSMQQKRRRSIRHHRAHLDSLSAALVDQC